MFQLAFSMSSMFIPLGMHLLESKDISDVDNTCLTHVRHLLTSGITHTINSTLIFNPSRDKQFPRNIKHPSFLSRFTAEGSNA